MSILPYNQLPGNQEEFKRYLSMDIAELEKLDTRDCANITYRLGQFAIYVQRCLNQEKSRSRVINNKIMSIIAPKINQYYGAWDMQKVAAIQDNDVAQKLSEELLECEVKQDDLEYVSKGITELANYMKNLQFSKKNENNQIN